MAGILDGKVALISGVSHDGQIGQTVAQVLAKEGAALGTMTGSARASGSLRMSSMRTLCFTRLVALRTVWEMTGRRVS